MIETAFSLLRRGSRLDSSSLFTFHPPMRAFLFPSPQPPCDTKRPFPGEKEETALNTKVLFYTS